MDIMSIIFIGLLIFVGCAVLAILFYVFQPKYAKESRMFSKKEKAPKTNTETMPTQTNTNIQQTVPQTTNSNISLSTVSLKSLFAKNELSGYSKLLSVLRNKNVIVLPKVNFSDFVSISSGNAELYKTIPYLKADFLICDDKTGNPIYIINDKKNHISNEYASYMQNIAQTLKIGYLEIDGVNDTTIAQIFAALR